MANNINIMQIWCYINYHWNNTKIKSIQSKLFQCLFYTNKALNLGHLVKVLWKHLNSTNTKGSPLCDALFNLINFDPWNAFLKIQDSIGIPTPKVEVNLGVCGFIHSHFRECKCDSRVALSARTFPCLCFGCEPKAGVVNANVDSLRWFVCVWDKIGNMWNDVQGVVFQFKEKLKNSFFWSIVRS